MADSLRILRGNKSDMPDNLGAGVLALCLDTKELYVGDGESNLKIGMFDEISSFNGGTITDPITIETTAFTGFKVLRDKEGTGKYKAIFGAGTVDSTYRSVGLELNTEDEQDLIARLDVSENGLFYTVDDGSQYAVLTRRNRPVGTYTGNGSATSRTINTTGSSLVAVIYSSTHGETIALVTESGAIIKNANGNLASVARSECHMDYTNNNIVIASTNEVFNKTGATYTYWYL